MYLKITEREPAPAAPRAWALWALGFRPFYLLAATYAALSVLLWSLQFSGWLPVPYLPGPLWHAHEMLFGFTLAVIVGFLFTAGRNWSGQPTPTGPALAALAGLWLLARVLVYTPYGWASAVANVAFPLAAAIALARALVRGGNRRNYFFPVLLAAMAMATGFIHATAAWNGIQVALDIVLFILCVMGGRVIPMFTNNGVPGAGARRVEPLEHAALVTVGAVAAADLLGLPAWAVGAACVAAGVAHGARLVLWNPWRTRGAPLVWVLHLAYAWIPVHLLLRAAAAAGWVASSSATHALTAGAVGGLVAGMMTRTAKGHTARRLVADRWDVAVYALVAAAAVVRVGLPLALPALLMPAVVGSALLWAGGFGLYAVRYWPVLTRARLDGQPG